MSFNKEAFRLTSENKQTIYKKLEYNFRKEHPRCWRNPYINDMSGFEEIVFNYDNTILFNYRYLERLGKDKKRYRNHSLLFNYCCRITDTHQKATLVFISLGKLGILDIVDMIEAKDYIIKTDPTKYGNHWRNNLYPPSHKKYFIEILNMLENGITI